MEQENQVAELTVMDLLRESTKDLHNSAEANEFQHQLGSGKVSKEDLGRYLQQIYLMHHTLGQLLDESKSAHHGIDHVVKDYHLDLTCVKNDLQFFGHIPESSQPVPATTHLIDSMKRAARDNAVGLLGYLYVLEGSTNGAKFLAKNLRAGLSLPEGKGASYFDRYGNDQRERWMAFKQHMNELNFSDQDKNVLVENAKEIFHTFGQIGEQLLNK